MEAIISLIYLAIFSWIVYKTPFFRKTGISHVLLVTYFILCVLIGWGHLWFAWKFFPGHGDMWTFYNEGVKLKKLLLTDLAGFQQEMRVDVYENGILTSGSFIVRIQYQFMSFFYMLLNLFSFSSNYGNIVLFAYLLMFGKTGMFMAAQRWTPLNLTGNLGFLLLPGLLFWTGVIHKEGLIYGSLGLIFYFMRRGISLKWILVIAGLGIILLTRSYVAALLGIGLIAGMFWEIPKDSTRWILIISSLVILVGLHCMFRQSETVILEQVLVRKREFDSLAGNTRLPEINLQSNISSFVKNLPGALRNGILLPYPLQFNMLYSLFSLECYLVVIIFGGIALINRWNFLLVFSVVFGIAGLIISGYTIPFAGALVRYRSLYLPFLFYAGMAGLHNTAFIKSTNRKLGVLTNYKF